jgi:dihydrofolate synthase/folylpolyglutamate synthase
VRLSFFEVLTAMAFAAFADAPVDVAVVEVGLGGTWDATNIADGAVAVVTPISIDHTRYLGNTIEEIAGEKAGIIKPGAVAVLAQQPLAAAEVLLARAASVGATVAREGIEFGVVARELAIGGQQLVLKGLRGTYPDVYLPLFGEHQAGNAACALAAVEAFAGVAQTIGLNDGGDSLTLGPGLSSTALDPDLVRDGFAKVTSPGRLEVVRRSPTVIVDAGHNPAGMAATMAALTESFNFARLIGVVAVSEDKDVAGVLAELEPVLSDIVVTANSSPRSMPVASLAAVAREVFGEDRVLVRDRLDDAIEAAVGLADEPAGDEDLPGSAAVLITGSVVTAGDARRLLVPGGLPDAAPPEPGTPARHSFTAGDLS